MVDSALQLSKDLAQLNRRAERVLVLGCPGAGKTVFSRELARQSGLPLFHLDDYYWGPGWSRLDTLQWILKQQDLVAKKRWIIDGNYLATVPVRFQHADLVVLIDAPTLTCMARVIKRAWRIRRGILNDLPAEVRRSAKKGRRVAATSDFFGLLWKILRFRHVGVAKLLEIAKSNPNCALVVASTKHDTRRSHQLLALSLSEALRLAVEWTQTQK